MCHAVVRCLSREPFGYDDYRYQSLEDACRQLEVPIEEPLHHATTDARLTAKLILKLAEIAERAFLPENGIWRMSVPSPNVK